MTTTPKTAARFAAGSIAALAFAGTLAGCATAAGSDTGTDAGSGTDTTTSSGSYTDGTYTASGSYQSPGGAETIEVTLTIADNAVTDVTVSGDTPSTPDAKRYQGEFEAGIADAVVGKNIDDVNVDRVGGSSLTSGGFNDALDEIKAEAAA